jgi:hypothetical protein
MRETLRAKYEEATIAKGLYFQGRITREEAKERIEPYLTEANEVGREIMKKYNKKHTDITFIKFVR